MARVSPSFGVRRTPRWSRIPIMHTNQVRKRQHSSSGGQQQQAAAAAFAVYLEATNRAPYKNFSIRRLCLKTSSATDLTSRSFGLTVGEDGLVFFDRGVNLPLVQQNQSRHLCASRRPGSHGLVGLIVGLVFGN